MRERVGNTSILLVEDSLPLATLYQQYLEAQGHQVVLAADGQQALQALESQRFHLVLLDLSLPDMHGFDVLRHIKQQAIDVSVVVVTANDSAEVAMDAVHLGAVDFLTKPIDASRLLVTVNNVLKQHHLADLLDSYQQRYERDGFEDLIGASPVMQGVYRVIESAASSRASIFITGESGTGKELCAEAIHRRSDRSDKPLITINCAAIPRDLMESEIFGHMKGAFTGAHAERDGAATLADGGTLFLDELCEMDLDLQSKLLRFIQSGTFQKVGSSVSQQVDIRFVCATNRDPLDEVRAGRFREDLYYRLHVIPLRLPPLRERGGDCLQIARKLLQDISAREGKAFEGFARDVEAIMQAYPWPGNVRELENVIMNMVVLGEGTEITQAMLPESLHRILPAAPPSASGPEPERAGSASGASFDRRQADSEIRPLWLEEKRIIERAIALCGGNLPKAAALLEVSASTLYRKRQAWEKSPVEDAPV
ncbi:sigma-54-dependent transcriptional regulator [Pseudomonas benzenivorans]|uniref:Sigma-54-dependent Fis family transcriptional regulator n=1 Tax=Pseudomonas benzenivorans TaxID=556533 RepID=A0ABY5H8W4_9PSED|nr:sigma-54 dependent transcriptional regulator [Pseudomonas benzenivorans]UTW08459.1 sigma-54-dependent Fis family transcriptional regulator [Pseudomonas benzenivorans]